MHKHQAVDASEYESELIYLTRQIKELEKDLEGILDEDVKTRIEEGLPKLRDRAAELEACPPTPAQTLEWLHGIEERLRKLSRKGTFRDPETRERLAVVHKRIANLNRKRSQQVKDEKNTDMHNLF
jgi:hypothetical protein